MAVAKYLILLNILLMSYVCDLFFFEAGTAITSASGPTNADGAVTVSTLSPTFTAKYNINSDFDYTTAGQLSGTFSGLLPATYTIYARSNNSCVKTLQVIIPFIYTWNPRHRLQFISVLGGHVVRFDIEDNQYSGPIFEAIGGSPSPIMHQYESMALEDIFAPVVSSRFTITLLSQIDGEYSHLNTYDELRFRGTLYLHDGVSYVRVWQGYKIPMLGVEPYSESTNYPLNFDFTDGLQDLANFPFSDDSKNAPKVRLDYTSAIVFCLNKTKLSLPIYESVNIYESTMLHGVNDSTLDQLYFDPEVYLKSDGTMEDSLTVLQSLLLNIGARLTQSNGVWMIDNPVLKTGSTTPTRIKAADGGGVSSSNIASRIMLRRGTALQPKINFSDRDAIKSFAKMYGTLNFVFDFKIEEENNLLASGAFEDDDAANGQFDGWQVDNTLAPFVTVVIEKITGRGDNNFQALKIPFSIAAGVTTTQTVVISSTIIPIISTTETFRLRFSVDILTRLFPLTPDNYIFIDYTIEIVDMANTYHISPTLDSVHDNATMLNDDDSTLVDGEYLREYVDKAGQWTTLHAETFVDPANFGGTFQGNLQVRLRINSNPVYDIDGLTALRAEDTFSAAAEPTRTYNNRRRVKDIVPGPIEYIRCYALEASDEADDGLNTIRPDDNLILAWKLKKSFINPFQSPTFQQSLANAVLIDNVQVAYLPNGNDPVGEVTISAVMNENVRESLDVTFRHGDLSELNANYKNITKGWLSLSDGTPTNFWKYRSQPASSPLRHLLDILKKMYQGQYAVDRQKLSGSIIYDGIAVWLGNSIYEVKTGKIHIPAMSSFDLKQGSGYIEMIEALDGQPTTDEGNNPDPDVEPPVSTVDFAATDFSSNDFYATDT